jgi:hypothetical protein
MEHSMSTNLIDTHGGEIAGPAVTSTQRRELTTCLRQLVEQLTPRLPDEFHEGDLKKGIDVFWDASNYGTTGMKLVALSKLTQFMVERVINGLGQDDPLLPTFVRSMELLCELGLAERREVDMESDEGEMIKQHMRRRRHER